MATVLTLTAITRRKDTATMLLSVTIITDNNQHNYGPIQCDDYRVFHDTHDTRIECYRNAPNALYTEIIRSFRVSSRHSYAIAQLTQPAEKQSSKVEGA
jgi:hypothetical protein